MQKAQIWDGICYNYAKFASISSKDAMAMYTL